MGGLFLGIDPEPSFCRFTASRGLIERAVDTLGHPHHLRGGPFAFVTGGRDRLLIERGRNGPQRGPRGGSSFPRHDFELTQLLLD